MISKTWSWQRRLPTEDGDAAEKRMRGLILEVGLGGYRHIHCAAREGVCETGQQTLRRFRVERSQTDVVAFSTLTWRPPL